MRSVVFMVALVGCAKPAPATCTAEMRLIDMSAATDVGLQRTQSAAVVLRNADVVWARDGEPETTAARGLAQYSRTTLSVQGESVVFGGLLDGTFTAFGLTEATAAGPIREAEWAVDDSRDGVVPQLFDSYGVFMRFAERGRQVPQLAFTGPDGEGASFRAVDGVAGDAALFADPEGAWLVPRLEYDPEVGPRIMATRFDTTGARLLDEDFRLEQPTDLWSLAPSGDLYVSDADGLHRVGSGGTRIASRDEPAIGPGEGLSGQFMLHWSGGLLHFVEWVEEDPGLSLWIRRFDADLEEVTPGPVKLLELLDEDGVVYANRARWSFADQAFAASFYVTGVPDLEQQLHLVQGRCDGTPVPIGDE